jgi:hypothetical protein
MHGSARGLVLAVLSLILLPSTAFAETRHAAPGGGASSGACGSGAPCTLAYALAGGSNPGDTVQLADGLYEGAYQVTDALTVQGAPGTWPVVMSTAPGQPALTLTAGASGATLSRLELRAPADATALDGVAADGIVLANVNVDTAGKCADVHLATGTDLRFQTSATGGWCADLWGGAASSIARMRIDTAGAIGLRMQAISTEDVVIAVAGPGAGAQVWDGVHRRWDVSAGEFGVFAALATVEATFTDALIRATGTALYSVRGTVALRNVTAVGATGIGAHGSDGTSPAATVRGVNVIARGATPAADAVGEPPTDCHPVFCPPAPGRVELSHANARTPAAANVVLGAGIQSADPLFVSATDLHLQPASPAKDAGTSAGVDSATDIDGEARAQGAAPDLGGDELPAPPVTPPPPPPGGAADSTAPSVRLSATRRRLAVTSSEAATLRVVVRRATQGRKQRGTCRAKTRRNRARKRCTRWVAKRRFTREVPAGLTHVALAPKLPAGRYRIDVVATDTAGNAAPRERISLRVKRR